MYKRTQKNVLLIIIAGMFLLLAPQRAAAAWQTVYSNNSSQLPAYFLVSSPGDAADAAYMMGELAVAVYAPAGGYDSQSYTFTASQSGFLHVVSRAIGSFGAANGFDISVTKNGGGKVPGRGVYCWYLTAGTYTIHISIRSSSGEAQANSFFCFLPDTSNAAAHKSEVTLSQDKTSAAITLSSPDASYVSYQYTSSPQKIPL